MNKLPPESFALLAALKAANGGALAVDFIVSQYRRRPLTALHKRGFVSFVNYANGEHAILTDTGYEFEEEK